MFLLIIFYLLFIYLFIIYLLYFLKFVKQMVQKKVCSHNTYLKDM